MIRFVLLFLLIPVFLHAEPMNNPMTVYEMSTENNIFVGVRAAGMGGAAIAAGNDGSSIWYNPALLPRIRKIELSGSLVHQRFFNNTTYGTTVSEQAQLNNTRLSSLWAVFPVPVEQGGLSVAVAANRIKSFDRIFRFEDKTGWLKYLTGDGIGGGEDDLGGLWAYSLGGGIEISRRTSVGLSLDFYGGKDKYFYREDEISGLDTYSIRGELTDSYTGFSGKIGLAYSSGPRAHFGAVISLPLVLTIEQEEFSTYTENGTTEYSNELGEYEYTLPFSFGAGALFTVRDFLITGDISYTDYTQLEYNSGVSLVEANNDVKIYYRDVIAVNLGLEYFIPKWGLTLRSGYSIDPIPFTYFKLDDDLDVITAGFSYLLDRTLKMDFAINFMDWTRRDLEFHQVGTIEKYNAQRVFLGFTYRI